MKTIAEKGFKGEDSWKRLEKHVGVSGEEEFKGLCRSLNIHAPKQLPSKSQIRIKTKRYQSKN